MFLGDRGRPNKYPSIRMNYDIIIDNEKLTLHKMTAKLGFYSILYDGKVSEIETIYDTDKNLLTGAGLLLRKKQHPNRTYFSLVRISSMNNIRNREKKAFLGECEYKDQPSDFPVQIADVINKTFNNLFTINVVDIVTHVTPYIRIDMSGNRYKIVSGTGYEAEINFENLKFKDVRTGKKAKRRNFSIEMSADPNYEKERRQILDVIEHYCKELQFVNRNRFEMADVMLHPRIPAQRPSGEGEVPKGKKKKGKKNMEEGA